MDRSAAFRRAFHLVSPIFLSYYVLPETLGPNIPKLSVAFLFLGAASCIEIARIALGVKLFGMRPYEGNRVSAYAQGMIGLAVGIFFVDPRIVIPVFLGMAWVDPLAAYARKKKWRRGLVGTAYFALFLATEAALGAFGTWAVRLVFAALATGTAMAVEGPRIPQVDDDLLMQVVPMAVLSVALLVVPGATSL